MTDAAGRLGPTTAVPDRSPTVPLAGSRARAWLFNIYERAADRHSIADILQILVGCWLCDRCFETGDDVLACRSLAREISRRLDTDFANQEAVPTLLRCDAALLLLSVGILRAVGHESSVLEKFIGHVASSLENVPAQTGGNAELYATRFLLHRLRALAVGPAPHTLEASALPAGATLVQLDGPLVRSLAVEIAAATSYGERPLSDDPELEQTVALAVPVWTMFYLRQYHLDLGSVLLRAMTYLNLRGDRAFPTALGFLLAQQQVDGHFGFLAPEIARMRALKPDMDEAFDLYLPLTVSCLWAIAEAMHRDFTLFRSF
jgi:hypothetical protein